nr:hypothetical protein [Tanacetum cinerariifolium]
MTIPNNHRKEEDQEGNDSSEIETLTYHVLVTYGLFLSSVATFDMSIIVIMYSDNISTHPLHVQCTTITYRLIRCTSNCIVADRVSRAENHISKYGFDPSYKIFIHHGEADLPQPPPVIDNTRQPQMSDMTACLNELSYIPLNNEQNEPTKGDISETSNEPTQAKRNDFEELYPSANDKLYPGCDYVTRLDFMAKFTYFKANGKLTDSIFNEMLEFFQNVFPTAKGYKLLPSYYAIKRTFKTIRLR